MPTFTTIALTGGPCAGKTTVLDVLRVTYGDSLVVMPEIATMLLENGFPRPGIEVPPSDEWFRSFQRAVLPTQKSMEEQYRSIAQAKQANLVVFDRGLIDGAAYMPEGEDAYLKMFNITKAEAYARYDSVIHLSSVATVSADLWNSLKETNSIRYETVDEACERDQRLRDIWRDHPGWHQVAADQGIDHVIAETLNLIEKSLT